MAKYKVGDIFISHKDGKVLQVCEGDSCTDCCYNKARLKTYLGDVSCLSLISINTCFKELPSLPPGTKVKMREDLEENTKYGRYYFVEGMEHCAGVTIKQYNATLKAYSIIEDSYKYSLEMFDQVINEPKTNNMETKEIKINIPEGYEIDEENSTFECIKLKPIKKELTYEDVAEELFNSTGFYIASNGRVMPLLGLLGLEYKNDKTNATNRKQLEKLLALNQLLNIAEYYNRLHTTNIHYTTIEYNSINQIYYTSNISTMYLRGVSVIFNRIEDAEAVISNPNFKKILDLIYKCDED